MKKILKYKLKYLPARPQTSYKYSFTPAGYSIQYYVSIHSLSQNSEMNNAISDISEYRYAKSENFLPTTA